MNVNLSGGGPDAFVATQSGGNAGGVTLSKFSLHVTGTQHGGEQVGPASDGATTATEISNWPRPSSSGEVDSPARGAIAGEELITIAASATAGIVPIASVVARIIEPLYHFVVAVWKSKKSSIRRVKFGKSSLIGSGMDDPSSILDVMYANAPYTVIQRAMHIHPTVTELIPTMLGELKPLE
jgi:hypothetical protein